MFCDSGLPPETLGRKTKGAVRCLVCVALFFHRNTKASREPALAFFAFTPRQRNRAYILRDVADVHGLLLPPHCSQSKPFGIFLSLCGSTFSFCRYVLKS
jgi:hypothetical protein